MLTCADCKSLLTGERQKTHIYYRCHTSGCPSLTVREDRLTQQLKTRLRALQVSPSNKEYLRTRLHSWLQNSEPGALNTSVKLRIADASSRLDRLTDLLIDGTLRKSDYETRKQNTEFELAQLREEEKRYADREKNEHDLDILLERSCDLSKLFSSASHEERRLLLKNCAEAVLIRQGVVRLKPAAWLKEMKSMLKDDAFSPSTDVFGVSPRGKSDVKHTS
jgi:hypothetical protein